MPARQADDVVHRSVTTPRPLARARRVRGFSVAAAVCLLLATYWLLATSALAGKSNTCDEMIHLAGGCSYWLLNDYRLQPENGNLPQRWHALPAVLSGNCRLPPLDQPAWKQSHAWKLADAMFYDCGNDPERLLAQGRAMAGILGVLICLTVFCWSRRLFGNGGGLVSLALAAFCPALLANGALMTSDACLTLFLLLSVWSVWELLHTITPLRLGGGMLAIAGLFLSKMSAPLIFPMAGLIVIARLWSRRMLVIRCGGRQWSLPLARQQAAAAAVMTMCCGLFAFGAVWAAYGFRYSAFAEGPLTDARLYKLDDVATAASAVPGAGGRAIGWMAEKQLLPEAYLYGTAFVLAHLKRVAFLNGEYSISGWRHYFPYCFAVKTPLALFGLMILSTWGIWQSRPPKESITANDGNSSPNGATENCYHLIPLLVLLAVYWASAIQSTFNIGYRHILPVYPVLYIGCGAAGRWLTMPQRGMRLAVLGLVGWFTIDSLLAYPHYITYFNPLVRRSEGYQHLVDSNLDWGQDLPGLAEWLRQHKESLADDPVYFAYFGNGRRSHYGIDAISLPPRGDVTADFALRPGMYCISATSLQAVYEYAPGRWNRAYEERYQARRRQFTSTETKPLQREPDQPARAGYEYAKYLRLLAYLRHRRPDANVGYSILIFRVTAEDLDRALNGPPAELDERPWLPNRLSFL